MADEADTTNSETTTEPVAEPTQADAGVETPSQETDEGTVLGGPAGEGGQDGEETEAAEGEEQPASVPESYELTPPEGFEALDPETVEFATPILKDLNLTNEQANKLMPVAGKLAERLQAMGQQQMLGEITAQRKAWAQEAQGDPEIGGDKWNETTHLADKALNALGYPKGSPFRSLLTDTGLDNHPEMIRAMRKVGELVSEDGDFVRGEIGTQVKKSREEVLYPADVKGAS